MLVRLGKLPAAIAYALGGTPSGDQYEVSSAVGAMFRAFGVGGAVATSSNILLESGATLTYESGDHMKQDQA